MTVPSPAEALAVLARETAELATEFGAGAVAGLVPKIPTAVPHDGRRSRRPRSQLASANADSALPWDAKEGPAERGLGFGTTP